MTLDEWIDIFRKRLAIDGLWCSKLWAAGNYSEDRDPIVWAERMANKIRYTVPGVLENIG